MAKKDGISGEDFDKVRGIMSVGYYTSRQQREINGESDAKSPADPSGSPRTPSRSPVDSKERNNSPLHK